MAKRKAPAPVVFRLTPDPDHTPSWYVRVTIYATREAFYKAHPGERASGTRGLCKPYVSVKRYRKGKPPRTVPIVCDVFFSRECLGIDVVVHELLHAAISVGRRGYFNWSRLDARDSVNDQEEWFVHVHSRLCWEFTERALNAGLYGEAGKVLPETPFRGHA